MELGKVEGNGSNDTFPGVAVFTRLSVIGVLKNIRGVVTHNISVFKVDVVAAEFHRSIPKTGPAIAYLRSVGHDRALVNSDHL